MPTPPMRPSAPPPPEMPNSEKKDPSIVVIPESYYGVAVKMEPPFLSDEDDKPTPQPVVPPKPTPPPAPPTPSVMAQMTPAPPVPPTRLWLIGLVMFILLAAGGGWVYWNRNILFAPPKPAVPVTPPKPSAPNSPSDLTAASPSAGTVRLHWEDRSETEAGFRVERKTSTDAGFVPVQTLPANSLTFFDPTAPAGAQTQYRVVAFNAGGDSPTPPTADILVTPTPPPLPPAPTLPPDGLDSDSDGLTDAEEALYTSDAHAPDTDVDGYLDGNEVFNLYAPTVRAPATLMSQLTMQTVSSTVGWQTLVPRAWTVETVTGTGDIQMRVPSGELFLVHIDANPTKMDMLAWLAQQKGVRSDQITTLLSNKYHIPFYLGPDRLTAYVPWEDRVVVFSYQLGTQTFVNFRTSFGMMLNALHFTGSPKVPDLTQPTPIPAAFQATSSTVPVTVTSSTAANVPGMGVLTASPTTSLATTPITSSSRP